jgi:type IV pilus assembly protein PilM
MPKIQLTRSRSIQLSRPRGLPSRGAPKRGRSRRSVVGLDIEAGAVSAAQVKLDGGIVVQQAAHVALEPGVVRDGEVVDADALAAALRTLFRDHGFDKRVRIGVANQRIVVRVLELPVILDAKELEAAVRFQAASELPMPLDQAVLDHTSLGVIDTPEGPRTRVLVVAARRDMIDKLLAATRAAGLRPEGIDLAAFAMIRALGGQGDAPVLHLAVGGVVNLAVARGGECIFTRVLPGGLEAMAIDLAERAEITVQDARAMLAGPEAERSEQASTVLEDGIRRIAGEVRNSLDFHLGAEEAVDRVLLSGPAVAVAGIAETLGERLSLPVEVADVAAPEGAEAGRFTVAAGLAVEESVA